MPDVVGSYRILRKIGSGGMGAVFVAEHMLIGRQAAIKVLHHEMSHRKNLVTRFFNEARAATAVKHPGIVEIYDFGYHTDGSAYIVMEYLEGETLAARLHRTGTLPAARAAVLGRQVAGALGAAHAKRIVHRDLKPENIFIVRDPDIVDGERTKLLDFGIAKLVAGDRRGMSKTRTGEVMGTPTYMSPEQSKGAGNVDARTDLYSLGCILFEMVCGRPPFVAEGGGEVIAQHILVPVPAPSSIAPVTPEFERFLLRALAKDPADRFQSAEEMSAALQVAVPAGSSPPASAASPVPARGRSPASPPDTTLSAAHATTRGAPPTRMRSRIALVVAVMGISGGLTGIAIGKCSNAGARLAKAPAPPIAAQQAAASPAKPTPPGPVATPPTLEPTPPAPAPTPPIPPAPVPASPTPASASPTPAPSGPALVAHVTIKLASEPPGADVYRMPERVHIGTTPFPYSTEAIKGEVVLIFKRRGYADQRLPVRADRDTEQTVTLDRVATARPHEPEPPGPRSRSAPPTTPRSGTLDPFDKLPSKPGKP